MGSRIAAYYNEAQYLGGLEAKIKLATLTRIPSNRAQAEPDSAETLLLFETAMEDLRKAFAPTKPAPIRRTSPGIMPMPRLLPGSEELLWGVLSSLQGAVFALFDAQGRCAWSWASKDLGEYYGAHADEDMSSIADVVASCVAQEHAGEIREIANGAEPTRQELRLEYEGAIHWLSVNLSPIHDASGRVSAVAAFAQDITQRKLSEERLRASEQRLRQHNEVFLDLVANKQQFLGDLSKTLTLITEASARTLEVARASIWFYDSDRTKIVCADLFELFTNEHSNGLELLAKDFPAYFQALLQERTIAAHNAHSDPRTSVFSEPYLTPLGINSLLDVPIWVNGDMTGVLCHEHIGPEREWTPDEINFAYLMADFVSLSRERSLG